MLRDLRLMNVDTIQAEKLALGKSLWKPLWPYTGIYTKQACINILHLTFVVRNKYNS